MTVAVRTRKVEEAQIQSTIKFGSYDPTNVYDGQEMHMLRTASRKTWDLPMKYTKFGIGSKGFPANAFVRFDPGLPYMYLDDVLYTQLTKELNSLHHNFAGDMCHSGVNICKMPMPCDKVMFGTKLTF
jgi:hypothetical protein